MVKVSLPIGGDICYFSSTTITYLWDVSDLDAPVLENTYLSSVTAVDHNQYIRGDRAFQSNYEVSTTST